MKNLFLALLIVLMPINAMAEEAIWEKEWREEREERKAHSKAMMWVMKSEVSKIVSLAMEELDTIVVAKYLGEKKPKLKSLDLEDEYNQYLFEVITPIKGKTSKVITVTFEPVTWDGKPVTFDTRGKYLLMLKEMDASRFSSAENDSKAYYYLLVPELADYLGD